MSNRKLILQYVCTAVCCITVTQVAGGLQSLQFVWAAENCPNGNSSSSSNRTTATLLQPLPALTPKPIPAVPLPQSNLTQLVMVGESPKVPERAGPPPPAPGKTIIIRPISGPADESPGPSLDTSPVVPAPEPVVTVRNQAISLTVFQVRGLVLGWQHSVLDKMADLEEWPTWRRSHYSTP